MWLPVFAILALAAVLSGFHQEPRYENRVLLATLNTFFLGSVLFLISVLAAREFAVSGNRAVLLLGCGSLIYSLCSLLAGLMLPGLGATLALYNLSALLAGGCFLSSGAFCLAWRGRLPPDAPDGAGRILPGAYAVSAGSVLLLGWAAARGWIPPFYDTRTGSTPLRLLVMGLAIGEFGAAGLFFILLHARRQVFSLLWYGAGLLLVAGGLLMVTLAPPGTLLGWLGRASQYAGAVYLLGAILFEGRSREGVGLTLELAYRESEDRYNALAELLPDAVLIHCRGECRYANRACLKLLGVSLPGGLTGRNMLDLVHPEDRPQVAPWLNSPVAETTPGRRAEFRLIRLSGGQAVVEMTSGSVRFEGRPAALVILRDVSERQSREADLRRLNRTLKAASLSDSAMMRAEREDDYLRDVCRIVGECGYATAWIGYAREGGTGFVPMAWSGLEKEELDRVRSGWEELGPESDPALACLRQGRPVLARGPGGRSSATVLALPLLTGNRAWGALVVHAPEPGKVSGEETALLDGLAKDLAYGVEALRLRESLVRSNEALRLSEERYRALVEESPDGIVVVKDGRIVFANPALLGMIGAVRPSSVQGVDLMTLFESSCVDLLRSRLATLEAGRTTPRVEGKLNRLDGVVTDVDVAASAWEAPEGRTVQLVMRDVTARRRYEQALRRTTQELMRSNQDLEQFAHAASHDLKEPLRMVTGFLSLLRERCGPGLDEKSGEFIALAVEAATRMQRLIDDLLAYSRVGRTGETAPVRADEALDAALKNLAAGIRESGAVIRREPLPEVRGNAVELTQLFQNLLGNAVKFRGARSPEIAIRAEREGGFWRFSVRDNGIGIDSRYSERIFQLFNRLHTAEEYPGTGIGLAICKKVVDRHGGRIWVESAPGLGATFHFTLPPAREEAP